MFLSRRLLFLGVLVAVLAAASAGAQEHTKITTQDGAILYADLYGKGERGVVLAHGGQFTRESWAKQAEALARGGFRVLAFDFRGFGQSPRPENSKGIYDGVQYDVLAAVHYLREHGARTVAVVGASFGGWAAAQASVESKAGEIDRIVLLAATPIDEPQKMKGRKLFIVARDDANAEGPRLPGIQKEYDLAPEPKQLVILEGPAHAQFVFQSGEGKRAMRVIVHFLSEP